MLTSKSISVNQNRLSYCLTTEITIRSMKMIWGLKTDFKKHSKFHLESGPQA